MDPTNVCIFVRHNITNKFAGRDFSKSINLCSAQACNGDLWKYPRRKENLLMFFFIYFIRAGSEMAQTKQFSAGAVPLDRPAYGISTYRTYRSERPPLLSCVATNQTESTNVRADNATGGHHNNCAYAKKAQTQISFHQIPILYFLSRRTLIYFYNTCVNL